MILVVQAAAVEPTTNDLNSRAPRLTWGPIVRRWKRVGSRLIPDVTVPANALALVHVPGENAQMQRAAGSSPVPGSPTTAGNALFAVPGGRYTFESRL